MSRKSSTADLPPGVERDEAGRLYWTRHFEVNGEPREQRRYVALDPDEARARRLDYYHPTLGWVLEGYKLATDRSVASIMADGTTATPLSVEEQERRTAEARA